ncbi:MAG: ATP--guanido phosphotransferase [Clostridia bacterium]|nr:ATP--guanido phosphotransferase [Clostridia bacterium]
MKRAQECTDSDLVKYNVISSRIRLARNVVGLPFPKCGSVDLPQYKDIVKGAVFASKDLFNADTIYMSELTKAQKTALVERHIISLPLANNNRNGALILDRTGSISIMLNEEDHIREQCVTDGFSLKEAYSRLSEYDDNLSSVLEIAYDDELGFLTACPTNLGTGMRASCMIFLPGLKRVRAIDDTFDRFKKTYGLTIRGVFGEGSDSFCDMYQLSNEKTLGLSEEQIIENVRNAVLDLCYCERVAMERLVLQDSTKLFDDIMRSYAILSGGAYSLSALELTELIVNVKMGLILEILPNNNIDVRKLDKLSELVSPSAYEVKYPGRTEEQQSVLRAQNVRKVFEGEIC